MGWASIWCSGWFLFDHFKHLNVNSILYQFLLHVFKHAGAQWSDLLVKLGMESAGHGPHGSSKSCMKVQVT